MTGLLERVKRTGLQVALIGAVAFATVLSPQAMGAQLEDLPFSWKHVPRDFVPMGHVPGMGKLWSDPDGGTEAPTYCVYRARVVCVVYRVAAGELGTWLDLAPIESGLPVDHVELIRDVDGLTVGLYFLDSERMETIKEPYDYHY